MSRNFADKTYAALTPVYHRMVLRAPSQLPPAAIAELAGYTNYNTMMSELSGQPGHKLGVEKQLALMDACDSDAPLSCMAGERGGVFIKLPQAAASGCELVESLAMTIKQFGEFASRAARHIADGVVDSPEMADIDSRTNEVMEAVLSFRKLAKLNHCGGRP